jgi:hypothetical protein
VKSPSSFVAAASFALVFMIAGTARADGDPPNECKELHCYCDGPDRPDTVASCDTTCEAVCGGGSSSGGSTGGGGAIKFARGKFGLVGGMPWIVRESNGSESSGLFSMGAEAELHMGRPQIGILLGAGIVATRLSSSHFGPGDQTYATYPLQIGLTSSPIGFHTGHHETRLDFGLSFIAIPCGLCDDVGGTAYGGRLKLGIDSVWGNGLFGVDLLLTAARAGQLGGTQPFEAWAPPVQLRLSVGGRNGNIDWPMRGSGRSDTPDPTPAPSSPPSPKPAHPVASRVAGVVLLVALGAFMYVYLFTDTFKVN